MGTHAYGNLIRLRLPPTRTALVDVVGFGGELEAIMERVSMIKSFSGKEEYKISDKI